MQLRIGRLLRNIHFSNTGTRRLDPPFPREWGVNRENGVQTHVSKDFFLVKFNFVKKRREQPEKGGSRRRVLVFSNGNVSFPFNLIFFSFPESPTRLAISKFYTEYVSCRKQELLALHKDLGSPRSFCGIHVANHFSFLCCFVCYMCCMVQEYDSSFSVVVLTYNLAQ